MCLQAGDVRRLQALGAARDFELNRLAVVQRFVPIPDDRGEVDENVLAGLALDEPIALAGIEPINCSLFFQLRFSFLFELFGAVSHRLQAKKEGCKCGLAAPLYKVKVLQEQQTHFHVLMFSLRSPVNSALRVSQGTSGGRLLAILPCHDFLE